MNPQISGRQLTLQFETGLVERWPTAMDYVRHCVHSAARPMKSVAADMDLSASDLSRKLAENPGDTRRFTLGDLERYIEATGDARPINWLVERFLGEPKDHQQAVLDQLATMLPALTQLLAQNNATKGKKA